MRFSPDKNTLWMRPPDNWHFHFRQGPLQRFLVPLCIRSGWRRRVAAEPNTKPEKLTGPQALVYRGQNVELASQCEGGELFDPVAIMQITEQTTVEMALEAYHMGVRVFKVYPRHVTTNSENGVLDYTKLYPVFKALQGLPGAVVQFHAEHPGRHIPGRLKESAFIGILDGIRAEAPKLRLSVEHISSKVMVEWVIRQPEWVGAGVAIQYLLLTDDDLKGYSERSDGKICVDDIGCKPCAKDPADRAAIQDAVLSSHPRFWAANDDAWHLSRDKHSRRCACGTGNTIASQSLTLSFFEKHGKLEKAEPFLSEFGALFYCYPLNEGEQKYRRESWKMPEDIFVPGTDDVVTPAFAGDTMEWRLIG